MIIAVAGIKGGTGKTTIATNLVVMRAETGKKVLLIDADEQRSSFTWANQRDVLGITTPWTTVLLAGKTLRTQVLRMKDDYNDIIIDVGGRDTTSMRAAISACDICLIPFKPRSMDIWTLGDVKSLISEMKPANPGMIILSIINQGDPTGQDNENAINILQECAEMKCLDITIGLRKAFANAASDGLGVGELKVVDKKAVKEIRDLHNELYIKYTKHI